MKTWHQRHTAFFGAKIPGDMAEAWTAVWALAGYTDLILSQAVLRIAQLSIDKRPQWPSEHIEEIERLSGQIVMDLAVAGKLGPKELTLAVKLAEQNVQSANIEAKKRCVGFAEWDPKRGLPEAKRWHQAKAVLEKIRNQEKNLAIDTKPDTNAQNILKVREIAGLIGGRVP